MLVIQSFYQFDPFLAPSSFPLFMTRIKT